MLVGAMAVVKAETKAFLWAALMEMKSVERMVEKSVD